MLSPCPRAHTCTLLGQGPSGLGSSACGSSQTAVAAQTAGTSSLHFQEVATPPSATRSVGVSAEAGISLGDFPHTLSPVCDIPDHSELEPSWENAA